MGARRAGARARTRGPGREQPRPPRLPPRAAVAGARNLKSQDKGRPVGRRPVSGGLRPGCGSASFWCPGRPEEPGPGRGGLTGPGSRDRWGRRRRCALAVSRSREEAKRTMSGRSLHLSTTERVIKGTKRPGPSSSTRGERALGRLGDGGREADGGPGLRPSRRRTWRGCGSGEGGIPTGAALPGPRAFSVTPRPAAGLPDGVGISSPATPKGRGSHHF